MTAQLDAEVARLVSQGFAVESRTESQAVLAKRDRIGWFWNSVLVIVTGGLWLVYVLYRVLNRKSRRVVLTESPDGRLIRS